MVDAAYGRRVLLRELAAKRETAGITEKDVVAPMRTSEWAVARVERGKIGAKLSTVERYAAAIAHRLEWRLKRFNNSALIRLCVPTFCRGVPRFSSPESAASCSAKLPSPCSEQPQRTHRREVARRRSHQWSC